MDLTKYSYKCIEFSKTPCRITELQSFIQESLDEVAKTVYYNIVSVIKENITLYGKHGYQLFIIVKWR